MATTTKTAKNGAAKQLPVFAKTYFPVQVAVFEHSNDGRQNFSVKLTRRFRLSPQDLLPAARLLGEAYEAIAAR